MLEYDFGTEDPLGQQVHGDPLQVVVCQEKSERLVDARFFPNPDLREIIKTRLRRRTTHVRESQDCALQANTKDTQPLLQLHVHSSLEVPKNKLLAFS